MADEGGEKERWDVLSSHLRNINNKKLIPTPASLHQLTARGLKIIFLGMIVRLLIGSCGTPVSLQLR
jgi:hypothetical protein